MALRPCTQGAQAAGATEERRPLLAHYTLGETIGQGAFGIVYACKRKGDDSSDLAVKMVDKVETPLCEIKREAEMMRYLEHPSVVKSHGIFFEKFFVCIVMDRYRGGDLIEGMQAVWSHGRKIPCVKAVGTARQMASAIAHLHSRHVVHRDIKGDNYLMDKPDILDPELRVFLTDFGTAQKLKDGERLSNAVGTKIYWPPEFYSQNYSYKVDVWALGVILYGMIDGRFPFRNEADTNTKVIRMPAKTTVEYQDFIRSSLTKEEASRPDAASLLQHRWIATRSVAGSSPELQGWNKGEEPERLREGGANAAVASRRQELVERLEQRGNREHRAHALLAIFWQPQFAIPDRRGEKELRYQWWSVDRVEKEILADSGMRAVAANHGNAANVAVVGRMLHEHGIDTTAWGTGEAKTLEEFAAEVQAGAAALMLDAAEHKKLVRVVDVVLLRVCVGTGEDVRYLVETSEILPDGRTRPDLHRLPGSKKEPFENTQRTVERLMRDKLSMQDCGITWDYENKDTFEEQEDSLSYPGVSTVYRKELITGHVTTKDNQVLVRIGAVAGSGFEATDSQGLRRQFTWLSEGDCIAQQVKLTSAEADDVSGLVQAPVGYEEEELRMFLERNGIDVAKFGTGRTKTLKEFSTELIKGEASIMLNAECSVLRVVDVVLVKLKKQGVDEILVEREEKRADKTTTQLHRLPGTKRRPDENHFRTAQRVLRKNLRMDENYVNLSSRDVVIFEEEMDSLSYPGIRTLYRKRIISGELRRTM